MDGTAPGASDSVELHGKRDGISLVLRLSRPAAEDQAAELRADGWAVEITEVGAVPTATDTAAAQRRRRALHRRLTRLEGQLHEVMSRANGCVQGNWEHLNRTRIFVDRWRREQPDAPPPP